APFSIGGRPLRLRAGQRQRTTATADLPAGDGAFWAAFFFPQPTGCFQRDFRRRKHCPLRIPAVGLYWFLPLLFYDAVLAGPGFFWMRRCGAFRGAL